MAERDFSASAALRDDSGFVKACQDLETTREELRETEDQLHAQADELANSVAALQLERRQTNDIFEAAPEAYLLSDAAGRVLRANARAAELLCIDPRFLQHKPLITFVAREDRARFLQLIIKTAADNGSSREEVRLQARGSRASVSVLACVSRAPSEEFDYALRWILCELPARPSSEVRELSPGASQDTARLLLQVSQELRTQLSSASGWLPTVRQHIAQQDLALRAIASITRAVRSSIGVAERLADYARLEREDAPLDCSQIALPELVGQLVDEVRSIALQRGFRLSALLRGGVPTIVGDPVQLPLALRRVLCEVARSTAPGGEVYVSVAPAGNRAVLTMRSSGCGIEHEGGSDAAPPIDSDIARAQRCLQLHGASIQTEPCGAPGQFTVVVSFPMA